MKAPAARHERAGSQSTMCVICLLGVLISAMSLGSLRLYGLYLEHRLAYVATRIEAVNDKNAGLEERYSSLLSPSRIYRYAHSVLNMVTAGEVETIRIGAKSEVMAAAGPGDVDSPGRIARLFTGLADAKD